MLNTIINDQLSGTRNLQTHDLSKVAWLQPSTSGDTGGPNKLAHGTYTWTLGPDHNILLINPVKRSAGQPWDTFYFYAPLSPLLPTPPPEHFSYGFDFQFPTAQDISRGNAIEWEIAFRREGWLYKLAYQLLLSPPEYRYYNKASESWLDTPALPRPVPRPGIWNRILGKFSIDHVLKTLHYDELSLDGQRIAFGQIVSPVFDNGADLFAASIQADGNGNADSYSVWFRNMIVRAL